MAFSAGKNSVSLEDILNRVTEADILSFYLNIYSIPCIICSPLREDKKPSFGLYSLDGKRIFYTDLATKERGGLFDLLSNMWGIDYIETLGRISEDIPKFSTATKVSQTPSCTIKTSNDYNTSSDLQCRIREWRSYDIEYWKSYGISLEWLKYAEVYPISHTIITKNDRKYTFSADKYAYAYVEHKEGKVTLKIYQPFNVKGHKWCNKHDASVISLWSKVPEKGKCICICSSLKDALCLWANTGIPSLAIQGEGYRISNTAINELKRRFEHIYILFDNDDVGLEDGKKLAELTGFTNKILPKFDGGKDVSDLFKLKGKKEFLEIILPLFTSEK